MAAKPQPVRNKLIAAQTRRFEILNEKSAGELIPASDVEREWGNLVSLFKIRLNAIPARVAASHPGNRPIIETLERELRDALAGLSRE